MIEKIILDIDNIMKNNINDIDNQKICIINYFDKFVNINKEEYIKYVKFDKNKYNRNVIKKEDDYEIVIISWNNGNETYYHDHPGYCIFKILEGKIYEKVENSEIFLHNTNDLSIITNEEGKHKMMCIGNNCVSIHFYSPPINCKKK